MRAATSHRAQYSLAAGGIFIILGVLFLLRNLDVIRLGHRWWALFFLIPIFYLFTDILRYRQRSGGGMPREARGPIIGLIVLLFVMSVFLIGMSWALIWPVFIIIGGLAVLLAR